MPTILLEKFLIKHDYCDLEDDYYSTEDDVAALCFSRSAPIGYGFLKDNLVYPASHLFRELKSLKSYSKSAAQSRYLGYHITSDPLTWNEAQSRYAALVLGLDKLEVNISHRYSDLTGYLWTDEELNYEGHDLLKELKDSVEKYIALKYIY